MASFLHQPQASAAPWLIPEPDSVIVNLLCDTISHGGLLYIQDALRDAGCRFVRTGFDPATRASRLSKTPDTYHTQHYATKQGLHLDNVAHLDLRHLPYAVLEQLVDEGKIDVPEFVRVCARLCVLASEPDVYYAQFLTELDDASYRVFVDAYLNRLTALQHLLRGKLLARTDYVNLSCPTAADWWVEGDAGTVFAQVRERIPFARFAVCSVAAVYIDSFPHRYDERGACLETFAPSLEDYEATAIREAIRLHFFKKKLTLLL